MDLVVGALWMGIDRAEDIPAASEQAGDDGAVDVGVSVEKETAGHYGDVRPFRYSARERSTSCSMSSSSASSFSISSRWS